MRQTDKTHLFSFDTEKFTAFYKHLPWATIFHPAPSSLGSPPATWSIPRGKSVVKTLSRQTLLKTEMVKWEWESLHTRWEFLPVCKVRTTEESNSALTLQSIFNVWRCFEWHWGNTCVVLKEKLPAKSVQAILCNWAPLARCWHKASSNSRLSLSRALALLGASSTQSTCDVNSSL